MTQLSEQQRQALQERPGEPVRVIDAATNATYVLVPSADYDRVRALMEQDKSQVEAFGPLMDEVALNGGWADPEMDAYDALDPRRKP